MNNYEAIESLLERFSDKLRIHRGDDEHEWKTDYKPQNEHEKNLFDKLGFEHINCTFKKIFKKDEIEYITGGWLEEYCYVELSKFLGNGIDDLLLNAQIGYGNRKNEYDVIFTKDNALYTIECKSLSQSHDVKGEILYKIGALQRDFGLKTKSYLVTTSPHLLKDGELKPSIKDRAEQLKTKVIKPHEVKSFSEIMAKDLKIES